MPIPKMGHDCDRHKNVYQISQSQPKKMSQHLQPKLNRLKANLNDDLIESKLNEAIQTTWLGANSRKWTKWVKNQSKKSLKMDKVHFFYLYDIVDREEILELD